MEWLAPVNLTARFCFNRCAGGFTGKGGGGAFQGPGGHGKKVGFHLFAFDIGFFEFVAKSHSPLAASAAGTEGTPKASSAEIAKATLRLLFIRSS